MIKRHKRVNKGWMRRTSRVYLNDLNKFKTNTLITFLNNYKNALNYSITRLWSEKNLSSNLVGKEFTDSIRERYSVTARLAQCIAKQSKEAVRSQHKNNVKRMPRIKSGIAHLDSRFITVDDFNGSFQKCIKTASGLPKMIIPFNFTAHCNKFIDDKWNLSKSIRLGRDGNRLFIDIIFEKSKPIRKKTGKVIGLDRGYNVMFATSDNQMIGEELKAKIKKGGKRRKTWHHYISTEMNRYIKKVNLAKIKLISLENLKHVKRGTRGKFSRKMNRLLSFWQYAKAGKRLQQLCEEQGVGIVLKSPWKTSQRCYVCGNIDKRNRRGIEFKCNVCGNIDNADRNAALNLEYLALAGAYSLRSLPS